MTSAYISILIIHKCIQHSHQCAVISNFNFKLCWICAHNCPPVMHPCVKTFHSESESNWCQQGGEGLRRVDEWHRGSGGVGRGIAEMSKCDSNIPRISSTFRMRIWTDEADGSTNRSLYVNMRKDAGILYHISVDQTLKIFGTYTE